MFGVAWVGLHHALEYPIVITFVFLLFSFLFTLISQSEVVAHDPILFALATWIGFWIPYFRHFTYDYGCFWRWLSNGWKGRVYGWEGSHDALCFTWRCGSSDYLGSTCCSLKDAS
ncbi:hypothetical protein COCC4DRAFT_32996 [Bipolaris maydis ATCC 48331]|uniref:Uncharacterized protein n=2 Tax=Cochliobolus heterostrophus TaxID=5016 RepID=M2UIK7_COCH5|nr:uncharacterized protein COCC4DRAFT_32996 [Bipolaris maydis ATCC 48331]EMD87767.1 hypothetical protein COCHEDRAFT_1023141 [Bipolaris maydis C5]KAJ5024066.1 hypothetical protein J3E73DRAFT_325933 [Bipolaris maydis]ENI03280.1 hypothetical protein COCC4DRAFT_32996 [Bipolaris maydis ATCC 48331]KAJ5057456.1 hypothetical protein J3E74DRAFT_362428 [Bipolaris maydis]KAJ6194710.1 hypothetical protein J3E72DRAFT_341470 [Bipolaris maydis]